MASIRRVIQAEKQQCWASRDNKDWAMHSLHKHWEWNRLWGKMIIKMTWKEYLSFEEAVTKNLHHVDHRSLCCKFNDQDEEAIMESCRKPFTKIFK